MNRRNFAKACLGTAAAASLSAAGRKADASAPSPAGTAGAMAGTGARTRERSPRDPAKTHIAFVLYEGMTALDLIGPVEVLTGPDVSIDFVWRDTNPVYAENTSNNRLGLLPTATFADIATTDILCVPGTSNPYLQMRQPDLVEWVATVGRDARWVTSVCTGAFILGAAGLLNGYRATTHWALLPELRYFGAIPTQDRVVHDRNRVTGAGVTSGIDFGLTLLTLLAGEEAAKARQLILEYDPAPPFSGGSPRVADATMVTGVQGGYRAHLEAVAPYARTSLAETARRLGVPVAE